MPAKAPASAQYLMAERLLPDNTTLPELLTRLWDRTGSWEQVSRDLYAETGIVVSGQTLRRWGRMLHIWPDNDGTKAAS